MRGETVPSHCQGYQRRHEIHHRTRSCSDRNCLLGLLPLPSTSRVSCRSQWSLPERIGQRLRTTNQERGSGRFAEGRGQLRSTDPALGGSWDRAVAAPVRHAVTVAASITFGGREKGDDGEAWARCTGVQASGDGHAGILLWGKPGVTGHIKAPVEEAFPGPGGHGPSMWIVVSGLSLVPLLVGQLDGLASLSEWQVMAAVALGGAFGVAFISVTWVVALWGQPLLDTFGRRGRWPLLGLWVVWAVAISLVTMSWAGAALSTVVPWSASLSVLLLALVAAFQARSWARGVRVPTLVVGGLTLMAAILVAPHILASALPGLWQRTDMLLGANARVGPNSYPFAVEWPTFWARLVDIAGLIRQR